MSAASRAREAAARLKFDEAKYGPFPTEPLPDPELGAALAKFYEHRLQILNALEARQVIISDEEGLLIYRPPKQVKVSTAALAMTSMFSLFSTPGR